MAAGSHAPQTDVLINLNQEEEEEEEEKEEASVEEQGEEEETWDKALSVERFGDIFTDSPSGSGEKMGRNYSEKDFEYHRHTFHHTHHPLSTHLPPPQRLRKRVLSMDRRRKKKMRKKKTSMAPSEVTPTIQEVDEEEADPEAEGPAQAAPPTDLLDDLPQFSLGSEEDLEQPATLPPASFHVESEEHPTSEEGAVTEVSDKQVLGNAVQESTEREENKQELSNRQVFQS
ncbi:anion exchange protein 3-like [Aplochiton taeniatus]